jgi:polyhydroxyalkanoate synthesis repressor PhaR
MSEELLIKRYPNRRLYDTERSTYVSLDHVSEMVKKGRLVKIIDVKTNEDLTAFVLTQIVVEEAKKNNILLPVPLLYLIIRYGENLLSEFFESHLEHIIENYLALRNTFEDQFKDWLELGMDFTAMAEKTTAGLSPFEPFFDMFKSEKVKKENT